MVNIDYMFDNTIESRLHDSEIKLNLYYSFYVILVFLVFLVFLLMIFFIIFMKYVDKLNKNII